MDDRNCLKSMTHHAAGVGTCTRSGMTIPSHPSSEMHLGRFLDHTEFQSWIVNFRSEVCSKVKNPTRALQWIKDGAAKSLDDLISPTSTMGKDFPDNEELDLMMTSALKRCYDKQTHFRKEDQCRRAESSKKDHRFLRGRQITNLICESFQDCSVFKLENDDIQDFVSRWEQALKLRQLWHFSIKKFCEEEVNEIITD